MKLKISPDRREIDVLGIRRGIGAGDRRAYDRSCQMIVDERLTTPLCDRLDQLFRRVC
jgi:hypothetical protein